MDLAIVKISMSFCETSYKFLNNLSEQKGIEVKYLCHGTIPDDYLNKFVFKPQIRMSAARSRNLLLKKVISSRVLFLDEDSKLSEEALDFLVNFVKNKIRGHVIFSGKLFIDTPYKTLRSDQNFYLINKYYCEWNMVYDRTLLKKGRLFPGIGVGSRHEFWSGEGICSLMQVCDKSAVYLRPEIVFHPPLRTSKDITIVRKYIKGYGFSMAYIVRCGSPILKIHTLCRFIFSCARDFTFPSGVQPNIKKNEQNFFLRFKILMWKLEGFFGL